MRAARVLDMLLVLQRRGRMTAHELAETLEVSERTILRDVDAFSEAGVPIVTIRGSGGGIELLDGFQTHLTGLTTDEALCLFLVGQPQVAHRLGLGGPTRTARNKLLTAIPSRLAEEADGLATWFLNDPDPWIGNQVPHGELRRLARSIRHRRQVELTFAHAPVMAVRPLGLALKAGSWHAVCLTDGGIEVVCIDELRATRLTNRFFVPPADFGLADFWTRHIAATARPAAPAGAVSGGVAERDADPRPRRGHLRDGVQPGALTGPAHDHQVTRSQRQRETASARSRAHCSGDTAAALAENGPRAARRPSPPAGDGAS
jgi:predicted DNA-binding transcriptional regulator YafY